MGVAYLHLRRVKQWMSVFRKFRVHLDGKCVDKIKRGAERTYELTPGEHELVVKIDWVKSSPVAFHCAAGEHVRLVCGHPDATWRAALNPNALVDSIFVVPDVVCGTCGYILFGLSKDRCPECGTQFNTVPAGARP